MAGVDLAVAEAEAARLERSTRYRGLRAEPVPDPDGGWKVRVSGLPQTAGWIPLRVGSAPGESGFIVRDELGRWQRGCERRRGARQRA